MLKKFVLYICMMSAVGVFVAGCQQNTTVPRQLIGIWKTNAPEYADRYIRIDEYLLVLGVGDGVDVTNYIQNIDEEDRPNGTLYTIRYKDPEEEKWDLKFLYSPAEGGVIRLQNKEELWRMQQQG
jgi:hypothetical protein